MMRNLMAWLVVPALAAAVMLGCDNKKPAATQDGDAGTAPVAGDTDTGSLAEGSIDTPEPSADVDVDVDVENGNPDPADGTPVVGGDHATDPPAPDQTDPSADASATHELTRSPFPEEGERLGDPIAAPRLSDHDPFENIIEPEDIPDIVPWEEAGQYVGYEITVEGRIVDIGSTRSGNIQFLNFHRDWRGKFYLVIFQDLFETLDASVDDTFKGKLVRVRGMVEPHQGRPQIKILSMDQVEFVEE